jgi:hypothetical protein
MANGLESVAIPQSGRAMEAASNAKRSIGEITADARRLRRRDLCVGPSHGKR